MCSEWCAPIVRHYIFRLCWIHFYQQSGRDPQNIKESKTFTFFVDSSIVNAKLVFVPRLCHRYSVVSDVLIEIGVHL